MHLAIIVRQKHAQFRGPGRTERNVVGLRLWPAYALRSGGLLLAVTGVLFLLGGLIQINPIWQWGPFEPYLATNGAQPDWYLGWLLGALRLMPGWELHIGSYTLLPNPFFGGLLFPLAAFALLYLWPSVERRRTGDERRHDLLDAPSDAPRRTAAICSVDGSRRSRVPGRIGRPHRSRDAHLVRDADLDPACCRLRATCRGLPPGAGSLLRAAGAWSGHTRRTRLVSLSRSSGRVPSTRISSPPSGSGSHLPAVASATISSAASRS